MFSLSPIYIVSSEFLSGGMLHKATAVYMSFSAGVVKYGKTWLK